MFRKETCKRCGACLIACPNLQMTKDQAGREILRLVDEGKGDFILEACAVCGYCDSICPTQSAPSELRKEILRAHNQKAGVRGLRIMSEDVPFNIMSAGLETEKEKKLERLAALTHPAPAEEVFYLGCALSYIYTDLAESRLFEKLPAVGGMKYCCGAYAWHAFGKKEAQIKGRRLLDELKKTGVKSVVTVCPECEDMLGRVYPSLVDGFDIQTKSIFDYLWEEHQAGRLTFTHPLSEKVTLHDSCARRKTGSLVYENPRRLLRAMGAEVVEMKHCREKSLCCGTPLVGANSPLAAQMAEKRVFEARAAGAQTLAVACAGCFALSGSAAKQGLETYHVLELAQRAIGEKPPHRIEETRSQLIASVFAHAVADPALMAQKYILEEGRAKLLAP